MNVLITGSKGFIGKHAVLACKQAGDTVFEYDLGNTYEELESFIKKADWIIHLAGSMRPTDKNEFYEVNRDLTSFICETIAKYKSKCGIVFSSSIQSALNNDYGISKLQAENILFEFHKKNGNPVAIFRLTNAFGKWSRPNYNSVVSTFCYNIAHDLPITINDPSHLINLVYIDDIIKAFVGAVHGTITYDKESFNSVTPFYPITLGELANMIKLFKKSRENLIVPSTSNEFETKLYATYLSYLPEDNFKYPLNMHIDDRGSFTEFIRTKYNGQVSVNISHPGITKGNHYHNTKNEKFLTVHGKCSIKFRKICTNEVIEYVVSGDKLEVVDIPTGYTHNITNIGNEDSVTIMWANEPFDPNNPDTFYEEV